MYEHLINTLRQQCSDMACGNCNTCVIRKAADAIEELFGETERLRKVVMKLENELSIYDELPIVDQRELVDDKTAALSKCEYVKKGVVVEEINRRVEEYIAQGQNARAKALSSFGCFVREVASANAIEVLSKTENTTRWIPVTERLPKTRESILGKKSSKVIVAFRFDDETQGTDTAHTLNGEWVFEDHITVVARTITHWMPLPEPPKEETK